MQPHDFRPCLPPYGSVDKSDPAHSTQGAGTWCSKSRGICGRPQSLASAKVRREGAWWGRREEWNTVSLLTWVSASWTAFSSEDARKVGERTTRTSNDVGGCRSFPAGPVTARRVQQAPRGATAYFCVSGCCSPDRNFLRRGPRKDTRTDLPRNPRLACVESDSDRGIRTPFLHAAPPPSLFEPSRSELII